MTLVYPPCSEAQPVSPVLLSVQQTCSALGIGRSLLYRLVADGDLRPVKARARTLFIAGEVSAWALQLPRAPCRQGEILS